MTASIGMKRLRTAAIFDIETKPKWILDPCWRGTKRILAQYYRAIDEEILSDTHILGIEASVRILNIELSKVCAGDERFKCWVHIDEAITRWEEIALEFEEYETLENLKKLKE